MNVVAGSRSSDATLRVRSLGEELAAHLRALLSDVICGHLDADLAALADELLLSPEESPAGEPADGVAEPGAGPAGAEEGDVADADEPPESPADELPRAEASEPPEAHAGESETGESELAESAEADSDELDQSTDARDGGGKALEAS